MQDGRKTSRFQEIDVNSFHEETVSSDRSGQQVVEKSKTHTRSSDDSKSLNVELESETFNVGDKTLRARTGSSVVDHDNLSHEQTMLNEVNMDFRIPGLPHSVVKHAQSTSVRELIQKIENHPDRHALQQDLRPKQSLQPVWCRIKENDAGRGQCRAV